MLNIPQNVALLVVFKAFLKSDHVTEATGKTIPITISKNGATTFSNPAAGPLNATEMANGWYKAALGAGDINTLGPLVVKGAEATIDDFGYAYQVVAAVADQTAAIAALQTDVDDIQARLPAALTAGGNLKVDVQKIVGADPETSAAIALAVWQSSLPGTFAAGTAGNIIGANLNATVSSRATQTSVDAIATSVAGKASQASVDAHTTTLAAISAKTTNLPASPAAVGSAMTLTTGERDAIASAHLNLTNGIATGWTPGRAQRLLLANAAGKLSISGVNVTFRDILDSVNAIVAVTDATGQRTSINTTALT
jgi:hypothetical protein